jgi:hypothetical protein
MRQSQIFESWTQHNASVVKWLMVCLFGFLVLISYANIGEM